MNQVVHVMMFVCGAEYGLKILHFLKALLFHRSTHVHIHFVADKEARPVLKQEWQKAEARWVESALACVNQLL